MNSGDPIAIDQGEAACLMGYAPSCADVAAALEKRNPERALRAAEHGCSKLVDSLSCLNLGYFLEAGVGTVPAPERAMKLYQSACSRRVAKGCRYQGNLLRDTRFGPARPGEAVGPYNDGCKLGDPPSCRLLVVAYEESGVRLLPNDQESWLRASCAESYGYGCWAWGKYLESLGRPASTAFSKGCTWKSPDSCLELSIEAERRGDLKAAADFAFRACRLDSTRCFQAGLASWNLGDHATANQTWEAACGRDDGRSCRALGVSYLKGIGRDMDGPKAQQLFRRACDLGNASGCGTLGIQYLNGILIPRNPTAARAAIEEACQKGSCGLLASLEYQGKLGKADHKRARELFEKDCELGSPQSCMDAAIMAEKGEGGPKDPAMAASRFSKACNAGYQPACNGLAYHLIKGDGVEANRERAFELWERACKTEPAACDSIGEAYEKSLGGTPRNLALAFDRYMEACNRGVKVSCANATRVARATKKPLPKTVAPPPSATTPVAPTQQAGLGLPDLTGIINSF